jgi:hypothetical protein
MSGDRVSAAAGLEHGGQQSNRRRLASSIGAEEAHDFALGRRKADTFNGGVRAVVFG